MDFIIALIIGGIIGALVLWMHNQGIGVRWYEWLIGAVGLFLLWFTIANYFGSMAESESSAATTFILVTGLPSIILLAVAFTLAWRRNRSTA